MRYADELYVNPVAASIAKQTMRANSIFDPDYTGVGHQPMNHDQLTAGYRNYTVLGSKCRATLIANSTSAETPGYFGMVLSDETALIETQGPQIIESNLPQAKWKSTAGAHDSGVFTAPRLELGFGAKRYFNVSSLGGAQFRTAIEANPTEMAFFHIWVANIAGNDPGSMKMLVEMEFLVKLSDLKNVAQS